MDLKERALALHRELQGKIEISVRAPLATKEDLSLAYTPGVAQPCLEIAKNEDDSYVYTRRGNTVAVVTDGTAVLGLGNIGAAAAMPVMEGKCALFKAFGGVDAIPLCLDTTDVDEIVNIVLALQKNFGGINLEDIAAPRCFEIERKLKERAEIPIFHDDQHGTAIVAAAALINALKLVNKRPEDIRMVISGSGAAGISVAKLMLRLGVKDVILYNINGAVYRGCETLNPAEKEMAQCTNPRNVSGPMAEAFCGADVFFGVSAPGIVSQEMVRSMNEGAIVFAMANPTPEIMPQEAKEAGAAVVGSGRSDFPNQINNLLAFPGIFKGALAVRARDINEEMKLACARAIAGLVSEAELCCDYVIPDATDPRVAKAVAEAAAQAARESGAARA